MVKTKLTVLALSAMAIGGIGMGVAYAAGAPSTTTPVSHSVTTISEATDPGGVDTGPSVLQGSQTAPDTATAAEATTAEAPGGVDTGPNVQQGVQSGPNTNTPGAG